jgi:mannose-6-phosphate isomerase-like protein (cupin superfamily)
VKSLTLTLAAMALACRWTLADSPQPTGARLWTDSDLESLTATLRQTGVPYTPVLNGKTYGALLLRRAVSGNPELHVKLNDFFVVLGGEGEIRVGGSATRVKTVAPDEEQGEKLLGGALYRVGPGDVLFVPANRWLQVLVAKGRVLRAIIIKAQ